MPSVLPSPAMTSLRRLLAVVILGTCLGAPVMEMFDQWDRTPQDGNDTEINLVIVVLCVGLTFVAARTLVGLLRACAIGSGRFVPTLQPTLDSFLSLATPSPNSRPPTPLRV